MFVDIYYDLDKGLILTTLPVVSTRMGDPQVFTDSACRVPTSSGRKKTFVNHNCVISYKILSTKVESPYDKKIRSIK